MEYFQYFGIFPNMINKKLRGSICPGYALVSLAGAKGHGGPIPPRVLWTGNTVGR